MNSTRLPRAFGVSGMVADVTGLQRPHVGGP